MTLLRRTFAAAVLIAAFIANPAAAEKAPRRLIVSVEAKGGDAYTPTELLQLSRSLMAAIQASGTDILLVDWGPDPFPVDDPDAVGDEVKRTADCWLVVTVGGGRRTPALSLASYDALLKKQTISGKVQLDAAFDFPDLPVAPWAGRGRPGADRVPAARHGPAGEGHGGRAPRALDEGPRRADPARRTGHRRRGLRRRAADRGRGWHAAGIRALTGDVPCSRRPTPAASRSRRRSTSKPTGRSPCRSSACARWSVDAGLYGMSFPQVGGLVLPRTRVAVRRGRA